MWFDGLYFLGVFRSSDKNKNAGLKPFLGTKKAPKRGKYTGDRGRTDTPSLERDFESRASANSATPA